MRIARTLPLAAKSCELFSSSAAKDFFAVTLRQPYSKPAAGFSFNKGCSKAMVLFLLTFCLLLLPLCESVIVVCFVVHYFMSILVLQSSFSRSAGCFA